MKKLYGKFISGTAAALFSCALAVFACFYAALPRNISTQSGGSFEGGGFSGAVLRETENGLAYFIGEFPIKTAAPVLRERREVVLCGTPFGIKVRSEGVMVISAAEGSPAGRAGIRAGDVILSVNGESVTTNAEIAEAVQKSPQLANVILRRGESVLNLELAPEKHGGALKIGLYVRDSAAGIGTLTFFDPQSGCFGGLGHAVSDVTTGEAVPLRSGEITRAEIYDVVKSREGCAGELCGRMIAGEAIGELSRNTPSGVFGKMLLPARGKTYPLAFRQEVRAGEASILTTLDGSEPQEYSIEIERINLLDLEGSKGMVIKITDSRLLDAAGGIVRGMSGSPIIQNGRFAGAVTHVLVNDPTRGYGVFAENMMDEIA